MPVILYLEVLSVNLYQFFGRTYLDVIVGYELGLHAKTICFILSHKSSKESVNLPKCRITAVAAAITITRPDNSFRDKDVRLNERHRIHLAKPPIVATADITNSKERRNHGKN